MSKTGIESERNPYRFFILGAGFSRPAGLPVARELWAEVYRRQGENIAPDLRHYARFREKCDGVTVDPSGPDLTSKRSLGSSTSSTGSGSKAVTRGAKRAIKPNSSFGGKLAGC